MDYQLGHVRNLDSHINQVVMRMVKWGFNVAYANQDKHDHLVRFGPEYDQTHGHEADEHT